MDIGGGSVFDYDVGIGVMAVKATDAVKALSREDRDCSLPEKDFVDRKPEVNYLASYLISAIQSAIHNCSCIPWYLPKKFSSVNPDETRFEACDIPGQIICFESQNISQVASENRGREGFACEGWHYTGTIDRKLENHAEGRGGHSKVNVNFGQPFAYRITSDRSTTNIGILGTVGGIFSMMHGISMTSIIAFVAAIFIRKIINN